MNLGPCAIQTEAPVVIVHRAPGWKLVRQHAPRAAASIQVEDGVDHFTNVDFTRPTARLRRGNQWLDDRPLRIGQITGIRRPCHLLSIGSQQTSHTLSKAFPAPSDNALRHCAWSCCIARTILSTDQTIALLEHFEPLNSCDSALDMWNNEQGAICAGTGGIGDQSRICAECCESKLNSGKLVTNEFDLRICGRHGCTCAAPISEAPPGT